MSCKPYTLLAGLFLVCLHPSGQQQWERCGREGALFLNSFQRPHTCKRHQSGCSPAQTHSLSSPIQSSLVPPLQIPLFPSTLSQMSIRKKGVRGNCVIYREHLLCASIRFCSQSVSSNQSASPVNLGSVFRIQPLFPFSLPPPWTKPLPPLMHGLLNGLCIYSCRCLVAKSYLTLCHSMNHSMPGFPVLYNLLELA